MTRKKTKITAIAGGLLVICIAVVFVFIRTENNRNALGNNPPVPPANPSVNPGPVPFFDKNRYPLDEPDSPWIVVNKKRPLPAAFVPPQLNRAGMRAEAGLALEQLMKEAANSGAPQKIISSYRSYAAQQSLYNSYVQKDGQAAADTYSARPGYSEHQTGLAADLGNTNGNCDLETCFATTKGGQWLAANAHNYGFTIRYAENKTAITGYQYEPWHIRYVGAELAKELHANGQTMEEFFDLPAAPSY